MIFYSYCSLIDIYMGGEGGREGRERESVCMCISIPVNMQLYCLACLQGSRLDDQRCAPPSSAKGPTVPDEDFFSLILRSQAKRMDEQRVHLPSAIKGPSSS